MKTPKSILPPEEDVCHRDLFIVAGNKTVIPADEKNESAKPPAHHERLKSASSNLYFFNDEESEISR